MPDHRPPRLAGDDRATLFALLQYQRASFVRKVEGLDTREAETSPVASGTSLLWLTNHLAGAEASWVIERFAGGPGDISAGPAAPSIEEAIARYRRIWSDVDSVVAAAASLDDQCGRFDDQPTVNLRWILAHLLEETARHAGHADIIRELIDGKTGR